MVDTMHTLKVTLRGVKPPVWRRIAVRSDTTLSELAAVLEAAMGWLGGHLHAFEGAHATYSEPDPEWPNGDVDERAVLVQDVLPEMGSKLRWHYDFGDGWQHDVVVTGIGLRDPNVKYPICLAGRRACPPEDCGGPYGYANLLDILSDPTHSEHDDMRDWVPPGFDPAAFYVDDATIMMRSPRPLERW